MNLKQEKLQLLGIYGVLKETFKLIFTAKTIFTQITLSFLLPLSFLIFTQTKIPNLWSIRSFPFNSALFFFSAVFFFLSTASTVFAAASTFADRELPFHQLLCVVPKICKQHLITFLCLTVDFFAFNFVALSAITLICIAILHLLYYEPFEFLTRLLILFLSVEMFYFALIWQMASVVSVFEADSYGFEAIARSKELLNGKMAMASILLILIGLPFGVILFVIRYVVVAESALVEVGIRGILGIVWMWCFFMFLLIGTVLCLVCKSCHRERIDKLDLFVHLQQSLESKTEPLTLE
ncbi:hypothetical protein SDJN03_01039, partial [Cucurbita argyrosperma subsp. sororia]